MDAMEIIISVIFVTIFVALIVYIIVSSLTKKDSLPKVETGRIMYESGQEGNPIPVDKILFSKKKFVVQGKKYNSSDYILARADGVSMKKKGINSGDIVYAKKFDASFGRDQIKPNDVLLILLNDERYKGYKIRVYKRHNPKDKNDLETFYYDSDGNERVSSKNHRLDLVQGVIKYKYSE
ncbi:MAG: hypothetical protein LBL94_09070 [Prevotellaceae bacterium]|jgi:hypothetical protein|nr:hypothetical protein [Prevotellaceae bacterium]